ncbi:MAG: DUF5060 domain-containing protein [Gemmatimonadota bacterium]
MERWLPVLVLAAAAAGCEGDAASSGEARERPPPEVGASADTVPLYGLWSYTARNDGDYDNPYDYREVELEAEFEPPDGRTIEFFGFHDGDGRGGGTGDVWRLRFMPDETGTWRYRFRWSDGTPGDSGSFQVEDTGSPGPLTVDDDAPRYFETARGEPFHFRGYDLHVMPPYLDSPSLVRELDEVRRILRERVADRGYNFTMVDGLIGRRADEPNIWEESWWAGPDERLRFDPGSWHAFEEVLRTAADEGIHVVTFAGMVYQGEEYGFDDFRVFLRYWTARLAPFHNFQGFSPTWEWTDIWSPEEVDRIMSYVDEIDPFGTLLSVHDCSERVFRGWLDFSMRQAQSRSVFDGNDPRAGQSQGACTAPGGVGDPFLDRPILGSEDIWETREGDHGQPRNREEIRRAAWGIALGGVLPLYSEWHPNPPPEGGEGTAEPEVRRMFDFLYERTRYRSYRRLNDLVDRSERQVASGIPGEEYLVYDEDGGTVALDLTGVSGGAMFEVLWFDPAVGETRSGDPVEGGEVVRLEPPFGPDAVVLVRRARMTSVRDRSPPPRGGAG